MGEAGYQEGHIVGGEIGVESTPLAVKRLPGAP